MEFGKALNCAETNRRVNITGNTQDYSGNLVLKINKVYNPIDKVTTDSFTIRTYDGFNKKVIERSFENLDPYYFNYDYPGPLITINNNSTITIPRGTQSNRIPIHIEGIAALNLTLHPSYSDAFTIIPNEIPIQIGMAETTFRISSPLDSALGDYSISWTIDGEKIPAIYTPIKNTPVEIIE